MRKILTTLLLAIVTINCSNDDNQEEVQENQNNLDSDLVVINENIDINNIYGNWSLRKSEYRNYGNFEELPYIVTGCATERYSNYDQDGTIKVYRQETTTVSNQYENNGQIIREYTCVGAVELRANRQFTVNGNRLTYVNDNGSTSRAIIQDLSDTEMIILWNDNHADFALWKNRETYIKL